MVLIPFIFGIGIIFFNSKNIWGWVLAGGSLGAFALGIIMSVRMTIVPMTSFELITILVLVAGGLGLFLNSLKNFDSGIES